VAYAYCFVSLEKHHATALVTCCEVVARLVELNSGDNISWWSRQHLIRRSHIMLSANVAVRQRTFCYVLNIAFVAEAPGSISTQKQPQLTKQKDTVKSRVET
jgi:hypothetical protein